MVYKAAQLLIQRTIWDFGLEPASPKDQFPSCSALPTFNLAHALQCTATRRGSAVRNSTCNWWAMLCRSPFQARLPDRPPLWTPLFYSSSVSCLLMWGLLILWALPFVTCWFLSSFYISHFLECLISRCSTLGDLQGFQFRCLSILKISLFPNIPFFSFSWFSSF